MDLLVPFGRDSISNSNVFGLVSEITMTSCPEFRVMGWFVSVYKKLESDILVPERVYIDLMITMSSGEGGSGLMRK